MINTLKKPFQLYVKSQEVQLNWIRNHPFQYLALNGVVAAGVFGYIEYKDRKWQREFEKDLAKVEDIVETPQNA